MADGMSSLRAVGSDVVHSASVVVRTGTNPSRTRKRYSEQGGPTTSLEAANRHPNETADVCDEGKRERRKYKEQEVERVPRRKVAVLIWRPRPYLSSHSDPKTDRAEVTDHP
jgi:hypothetical protein